MWCCDWRYGVVHPAVPKITSHTHRAAAYYNCCRVHQTLRMTPAMEAGIADHIWSEEIVALLD
jgi:hypothetical protein